VARWHHAPDHEPSFAHLELSEPEQASRWRPMINLRGLESLRLREGWRSAA
jgi:hypothetical protein